jgi:hypothetical protein
VDVTVPGTVAVCRAHNLLSAIAVDVHHRHVARCMCTVWGFEVAMVIEGWH